MEAAQWEQSEDEVNELLLARMIGCLQGCMKPG